jgi:hypothetical protein
MLSGTFFLNACCSSNARTRFPSVARSAVAKTWRAGTMEPEHVQVPIRTVASATQPTISKVAEIGETSVAIDAALAVIAAVRPATVHNATITNALRRASAVKSALVARSV